MANRTMTAFFLALLKYDANGTITRLKDGPIVLWRILCKHCPTRGLQKVIPRRNNPGASAAVT
jgi:hypothetical protein